MCSFYSQRIHRVKQGRLAFFQNSLENGSSLDLKIHAWGLPLVVFVPLLYTTTLLSGCRFLTISQGPEPTYRSQSDPWQRLHICYLALSGLPPPSPSRKTHLPLIPKPISCRTPGFYTHLLGDIPGRAKLLWFLLSCKHKSIQLSLASVASF